MCRNIKTLFNFEPPATEEEIRASALQFVRKLSGFGRPSQAHLHIHDNHCGHGPFLQGIQIALSLAGAPASAPIASTPASIRRFQE